jgi:hypothetical protein
MIDRGRRLGMALAALGLAVAGCAGDPAPNGDGGAGRTAGPAQSSVTIRAGALEPFTLEAGRYRFSWAAAGCAAVDFTMVGTSSGFTYAKASSLATFTAIVSDVPQDTYELDQSEAACTEWSVMLDRIGS